MDKQVVKEISTKTISNLEKNDLLATPIEYKKEFCNLSKEYNLTLEECEQFKQLIKKLSKKEQLEIKSKNITTMDEMIPILLNRISTEHVDNLAQLFQESITPSISIAIDEDLEKFSVKIGNSPALLFEDDIQKEMQEFITKRFEADRQVVKQKTSDVAKLLTLMGQCINDAIHSSGSGSQNVSDIKSQIESINLDKHSINELSSLQSKLIDAALSIENEMNTVGQKLNDGKSEVETLEQKVRALEEELNKTRENSLKDHLTGLLTRRAYEDAVKRVESNYARNDTQYAIVFFDLDHFKKINDNFGHKAGDIVLSTFAKILAKNTRDSDIVGRYGGEEFIAIIHFNLKRELLKYLKRVKAIVTENKFVFEDKKIGVTFSAGVSIRNNHDTYDNAIVKADMLLYQAKADGRNKVILEDGTSI